MNCVHTILFGISARKHALQRIDERRVWVELPAPQGAVQVRPGTYDISRCVDKCRDVEMEQVQFPYDARDRRDPFVFEGTIPWGGIPRGATVATRIPMLLGSYLDNFYRPRYEGEEATHHFTGTTLKRQSVALVPVYRYVLLLPAGDCILRTFSPRTLKPRYKHVVRRKGEIIVKALNKT